MSQNTQSKQINPVETPMGSEPSRPKRPRARPIKIIGASCLMAIVCLGAACGILSFSGVLSGPHGNLDKDPVWSPDGSQIAFASDRGGNLDIYMMKPDGSHIKQLTRDPFAQLYLFRSPTDAQPNWSPDNQRIVFTSGRDNTMMSYIEYYVYVMNVDGSAVRNLADRFENEYWPAWSPDGNRIAFISDHEGDYGIYVVDADGSHQTKLTSTSKEDSQPAWSPDSKRITFATNANGNWDIYMMDADGTNVTRLTFTPSDESNPAWSPDGSQIAFASDANGNCNIYVMDTDGAHIKQLTNDKADDVEPDWSPDGSRIAFVSNRDGDEDIYVMNADGSNVVQLTGKSAGN